MSRKEGKTHTNVEIKRDGGKQQSSSTRKRLHEKEQYMRKKTANGEQT
ncbi:MAG: hypothetical protein IJQ71_03060 [Clostridia bacterium]|nr:hypothetical protein [Clostridia bacterium]